MPGQETMNPTDKETGQLADLSWHTLDLGDAQLADGPMARFVAEFAAVHAEAGGQAGFALFMRHESPGRLHCTVRLYYSPLAAAAALAAGALRCPRPQTDGLSLVAGDDDAWRVLFPGR